MKSKINEHRSIYKHFIIASMIIATSLIATTGYSQVYVNAHVGFGVPAPRVYCAPPPAPVVYQEYAQPAPVAYGYAYPNAAYYAYPAWHGHYRDRWYYEHYRPYFERSHSRWDRGHRW